MTLLARLLPIADDLKAGQESLEETLRELAYSHDRDAFRAQLKATAERSEAASFKAYNLIRAMDAGFGTLPELPRAPDAEDTDAPDTPA